MQVESSSRKKEHVEEDVNENNKDIYMKKYNLHEDLTQDKLKLKNIIHVAHATYLRQGINDNDK